MSPEEQTLADRRAREIRLAEGILAGNEAAVEEFVAVYTKPVKWILVSRTKCDDGLEELIQDTLTITIQQVRAGNLRAANLIFPYMRTIAVRLAAEWVRERAEARKRPSIDAATATKADTRPSPEREFEVKEQAEMMRRALHELTAHQQEILTRFYLNGESPAAIQAAMGLTETQFRLHKCRAKQRLVDVSRKLMDRGRQRRALLERHGRQAA